MNAIPKIVHKVCAMGFVLIYPILLISIACSCTSGENSNQEGNLFLENGTTEANSPPLLNLADSSNLSSAQDSLDFAVGCIIDHDRNDIASRFFKQIIFGWNPKDSCNQPVSGSFAWLAWQEKAIPDPDTMRIFALLDSAILACSSSFDRYIDYGTTLLQFGREGSEPYFNQALKHGADIDMVLDCVLGHTDDLVDTSKLNIQWVSEDEVTRALHGE